MRRLAPAAIALALLAVSACGYALAGREITWPATIKRVGVPTFENQSTTADLDRVLSEAVRIELQSRGRFVVVQDSTGVDALVTGVVKPIQIQVLALTDQTRQASKYAMTVIASIEAKDVKENKLLWSNPAMRATEEYEATGTIAINDPAAIFSQDSNALSRLAKAFARAVVTAALEGS
jgi:outer membrane lipopolysaccharide assembly protein LptE/RlpB